MSKTNNLTEFLTGLADKFRSVLGTDQPIEVQSFEDRIDQVYARGSEQSVSALQSKEVSPSTAAVTVRADSGYYGLSSVTVKAVDAQIDANILPSNIRQGVTVLGVTGSYGGSASPGGSADTDVFYYSLPVCLIGY